MIIMYNNLLKRIIFPSLSIYFFPHFFTFFPIPKSKFRRIMGKMEIFSILKIESLFSSLSIYFFPHFCPSPNPNFGVSWGKMGLVPPHVCTSKKIYLLFGPPEQSCRCLSIKPGWFFKWYGKFDREQSALYLPGKAAVVKHLSSQSVPISKSNH